MEFSSLWYFSFWSLTSQIFIVIGLNALHKAVDETISFWAKFLITYSVCFSCTYAFLFRPSLEQALFLIMHVEDFLIELVLRHQVTLLPISVIGVIVMVGSSYSSIVHFFCLLVSILPLTVILLSVNSRFGFVFKALASPFVLYPYHTLCWIVFNLLVCVIAITLRDFDYKSDQIDSGLIFYFLLKMVETFLGCSILSVVVISAYLCCLNWFRKRLESSPTLLFIHKNIKFVEVVLGVVAYIMVQYIIQDKSMSLMLALLSFTIAWVGIVAIVQPPTDFGVFTFLIGGSVDCAISVFMLGRGTWIISGVCILLIIIYRKLDSVLLLHSGVRGGVLKDWSRFELYKLLQLLIGITDTDISGGNNDDEQTWLIQMSPTTCLKIKKGDITKWFVDGSTDAIVNPTNERMNGDGGCDGAIHASAGDELYAECNQVPQVRPGVRCPVGEARITKGHRLPVSHVIHTVGPVYFESDREVLLRSAYKKSLELAKANNIKYIAFPAISCGTYGYPIDEAAEVALSTVKEHANELKEVHFVLLLDEVFDVWLEKALGCKFLKIR